VTGGVFNQYSMTMSSSTHRRMPSSCLMSNSYVPSSKYNVLVHRTEKKSSFTPGAGSSSQWKSMSVPSDRVTTGDPLKVVLL
jgi:hypothetical protein